VNGRPWTKREIAIIRRDYPHKATKIIAADLGRPLSGVYKAANDLGVKKSATFLASSESGRLTKLSAAGVAFRYPKGHVPANAGLRRPGWAPGRMATTQFKKGRHASESRNYKPIGTLRICADGLLERKVTDDPKIVPARRWVGVHRLVWSAANGPIPAGHAVVFKPGRATTDIEKITIDALECVSRPELMRRNSYHTNYPKPIRQLIQLRGAVQRQINKRSKNAANG
jgi:hypothetical protein